ncbi:MAG: hypothetical protein ABF431_07440 [Bifidobacterium sp.]|uniref:hypothetical protein n=1 Tax=Bifidobacterium sp. TaxID=41200 RepID=UPI0039EA5854
MERHDVIAWGLTPICLASSLAVQAQPSMSAAQTFARVGSARVEARRAMSLPVSNVHTDT